MFCTARGSQTVSTVAVLSWIPPAVWEGRSQFFHVLANTCHFPIFPPKVVLSVKRCFTVADSVSPMTNDSEQSPVVLVFLLSLDPVPCPRTPPHPASKLAPSSWAGLQPARACSPGWVSHFWLLGMLLCPVQAFLAGPGPQLEPQWLFRFRTVILLDAGAPSCPAILLGAAPSVQVVLRTQYTGIDRLLLTFRAGLLLGPT